MKIQMHMKKKIIKNAFGLFIVVYLVQYLDPIKHRRKMVLNKVNRRKTRSQSTKIKIVIFDNGLFTFRFLFDI